MDIEKANVTYFLPWYLRQILQFSLINFRILVLLVLLYSEFLRSCDFVKHSA